MRVQQLKLQGFRGFAGDHSIDLDADAVVVVGPNGQGKTSLFDGILWALTGRIPRLGEDDEVVSVYSGSGQARVELVIGDSSGARVDVIRSHDGERQQLAVKADGTSAQGEGATAELLSVLWPEALHASDGLAALTSALTRSVYLQQDLVREFIEADTEQDRFAAVSELFGAGRVTELAVALEKAKTAWSRATNVQADELRAAERELSSHVEQLEALTGEDQVAMDLDAQWKTWWKRAAELDLEVERVPELGSSDARRALDVGVKGLDTLRRNTEQRALRADQLLTDLESRPSGGDPMNLDELRSALERATSAEKDAKQALGAAQLRAAERRRLQVQEREAAEELTSLAQLALRHIDGDCPVCGQDHDVSHTRERLGRLVERLGPSEEEATDDEVSRLAGAVEEQERAVAGAQSQLRDAERMAQEEEQWRADRDGRLKQLGIDPDADHREELVALSARARERAAALDEHQALGERLSLAVVRAGEQARRAELATLVDDERAEVGRMSDRVSQRQDTGELAGVILERLRDASAEVVAQELNRVEPVLRRIYATADPHPSFRAVRLLTRVTRGRGRLSTALEDVVAGYEEVAPEVVLSSSQMNALAVSVFLAMNLSVPSLPLRTAVLDDPLQSLDDVNLLGLIDLLRRTKERRQLIISTHDPRFGRLLARKLRPVREGDRTRVIELDSWGREGPVIREHDADRDPRTLRIAA